MALTQRSLRKVVRETGRRAGISHCEIANRDVVERKLATRALPMRSTSSTVIDDLLKALDFS